MPSLQVTNRATLAESYKAEFGVTHKFTNHHVNRLKQALYNRKFPPEQARKDTPLRLRPGHRNFTPDVKQSRPRTQPSALDPFSPNHPELSRVKAKSDTRYRQSDPYDRYHFFVATEGFLHEIVHRACQSAGKVQFAEMHLRRFNMSRVCLTGLGARLTPIYCSPFLTVNGVTASLLVWRISSAVLLNGIFVSSALRLLQMMNITKELGPVQEDVLREPTSTAGAVAYADDMQDDDVDSADSCGKQRERAPLTGENLLRKCCSVLVDFIVNEQMRQEERILSQWKASGKAAQVLTDARYDSGLHLLIFGYSAFYDPTPRVSTWNQRVC